jgi:hypothetical protein
MAKVNEWTHSTAFERFDNSGECHGIRAVDKSIHKDYIKGQESKPDRASKRFAHLFIRNDDRDGRIAP